MESPAQPLRQPSLTIQTDGLEHFHQGIDGLEQLEAVIRHAVGDHGVIHVDFIDEALADQVIKVFLYLAIAHVSAVHDLGFTGAILANLEHIPNNLYIRSPLFHTTQ
jgi:hypothetical protein